SCRRDVSLSSARQYPAPSVPTGSISVDGPPSSTACVMRRYLPAGTATTCHRSCPPRTGSNTAVIPVTSWGAIFLIEPRPPSVPYRLRYAASAPGGNRHDLPPELSTKNWINHRSGSGDVMGRLHLDRPSVTIRTEFYKPEKGRYLHPWADRPITHYEAALLQGFSPDFLWCGSKAQIARQIGNAVPVGLARALAAEVYGYLKITENRWHVAL